MFSIILYASAAVVVAIYLISKRKFDYWKKQNVPFLPPIPILGNYADFILQKRHIAYVVDDIYSKFPDAPYVGAFFGTEPTLIVKDPELLKLVMTKEFYFFNGREVSNYKDKEEFNKNLFSSNGDDWKVVRQNLTPVFTSAKMKNMFHLIAKCSHEFETLLEREVKDEIEVRALISRFTMACIVSCGFGMDSDTLNEGFEKNPFTKVANTIFSSSRVFAAKAVAKSIWPAIFYALGFELVPAEFNAFFKKLMTNIFAAREYKPSQRNDFVDFLMNFKEKSHITGDSVSNLITGGNQKVQLPVTDDLLVSQASIFFLAGFETSATTTSFTLFELAKNPDVQKRVHEEIDTYLTKYDNKLTYDIVNELPYTYACVEETMRLYPVLTTVTREVIEDFTLPTGVHLKKGVRIHLPLYNLHRDPKYFPEPEVYRPDRFFGEERKNIVPYSYIPFGEGSRICIGMRFAKMQVLAGLVTVLKKYSVGLAPTTARSVTFDPLNVIPIPKHPLKLSVTFREDWKTRNFVRA